MSARRRRQKKAYDTSSWKIPYGTMMLLCMIFFMILYALSFTSGVEYEGVIARLQAGVSQDDDSVKDVEMAEKIKEMFSEEDGVIQMNARRIKIMLESPVLFASGASELKKTSYGMLHKVAQALKLTDNKVNVSGHTDNIPFRKLPGGNFELSTLRAFSVIRYFIDEEGISPSRFSAYGFGEYSAVADNSTAAGRLKNRRIEISILRTRKKKQAKG